MKIKKAASAGTLESSDVMVTLEPKQGQGVEIELKSTVEKQYGRAICQVVESTLSELKVECARVIVVDNGAVDCAIRARVKAAAYRAAEQDDYHWGGVGI